jgi:hypothetical protein
LASWRSTLPPLVVAALLFAPSARAVDPFEIQVYDGTANAPGVPGLELHLNHVFGGHRSALPPEIPLIGQTHATFEPSIGITPWWEIGAYLQTALREDGAFDYAGAKLRSKFVTPPSWHPHWRLGANFELSLLPESYDRDRWGTEIRPIVAWADDDWLFAFNPIVDQSLAGPGASDGPSFEPAIKAARDVMHVVALGFEYYGNIGPIASPAALRDQEHYLYEVVDVVAFRGWELNIGLGEGLTPASEGVVAKIIVGYTFERTTPRRAMLPRHRRE